MKAKPRARPKARPAAKKPAAASAPKKFGPRKDLGAPIEAFFAKQPPNLRQILDQLREIIAEVAPETTATTKWGMPFYAVGANTLCALAAFKAHVNLILPGPPGTYTDPGGLLEGDGKTGKHLKLRPADTFPRAAVRGWLRTAAARARG